MHSFHAINPRRKRDVSLHIQANRSATPRVVVGGLSKGKRYAFALTVQVKD